MGRDNRTEGSGPHGAFPNKFVLQGTVARETVDGHNDWNPESFQDSDMPFHVGESLSNGFGIGDKELRRKSPSGTDFSHSPVHPETPGRDDKDCSIRSPPQDPALDIKKFLAAQIGSKTRFGHDNIGCFQGHRLRRPNCFRGRYSQRGIRE